MGVARKDDDEGRSPLVRKRTPRAGFRTVGSAAWSLVRDTLDPCALALDDEPVIGGPDT
jgi:hypothetical protein